MEPTAQIDKNDEKSNDTKITSDALVVTTEISNTVFSKCNDIVYFLCRQQKSKWFKLKKKKKNWMT